MGIFLSYEKETDLKYRWRKYIEADDESFKLYILQWRVPEPVPEHIEVSISSNKKEFPATRKFDVSEIESNPNLRNKSIFAEVKFVSDHTKTIRYDPVGEQETWEIGSPYIPLSLLPDKEAKTLYLLVNWLR